MPRASCCRRWLTPQSGRQRHGVGMRVNLTERFAKSVMTEGRKSPIFYDEVIGFGLQVRDNGRKTFTLDYTFEGRRRRYFIGDHPAGSVTSVREQAKHLRARSTP